MPHLSQGAISLFTVLCADRNPCRCRPSNRLLLLSESTFEWRRVPTMALRHVICRACTMTGLIWLPSFLILGHQIIVRKARWGLSLLLYRKFAYIPLYWEWMERVLTCFDQCFEGPLSLLDSLCVSILTTVMLMSCTLFVRVGVLPPTPSTPYPESYWSFYGTFIGLVVFRSTSRFMKRLSLYLKFSIIEISRARG